ncbi:cupin domain-containing protein [Mycobacterium hackensackense]|uniref:(R)-mandelonitrile lyase n=1 Tax=Mycobacterium hackensackense TaxID=228909 RepID=UPI002265D3D6|nr:cupin domain-containing protein [Mycobacterium hackensackense]MCV7255380.1 cupin domain-containing protein [Mycobacterium hackensackense]
MKQVMSLAAVAAALMRTGLYKTGPAAADPGVVISPDDSRPAVAGSVETFTGHVNIKAMFNPDGVRTFGAAEVTFAPCARTAWHTHPAGQTLVVTSGTGWVQEWGGPKQQINPGDVIWTRPGVKHWHGAAEDITMSHIAIQAYVAGSPVDWMEHVTDDQYFG